MSVLTKGTEDWILAKDCESGQNDSVFFKFILLGASTSKLLALILKVADPFEISVCLF